MLPSFTIPPSLSYPVFAKNLSRQEGSSCPSSTSLCQRMSILSLFISLCLGRPLSHLHYSLHLGESTHLPSYRATPLPSINSYSPLGGDWYQHPPSFLSSLSTPSCLYIFSPPLSLLLWHPLFLTRYLCVPLRPSAFNLKVTCLGSGLAYKLLIKMRYVSKCRAHSSYVCFFY